MTMEVDGDSVVLLRGGVEESRHRVDAAVIGPGGDLVAWVGNPDRVTFMRSAAKPFQALPLVADGVVDALGLSLEEVALACGSHGGEPRHVEVAVRLLERIGCTEDDLACGPHPPMNRDAADRLVRAGGEPGRIHNNCSGKHAGMLALSRFHGWGSTGYHRQGHPVQERMARELARWSGIDEKELHRGVDGCGVVCFGLSLRAMAHAFGTLVEAADAGDPGPRGVLDAMLTHPFMVGGTGRLCSELSTATRGGVVAKVGAEGIYCAGVRGRGLGVALKVADGSRRASEVALLAMLEGLHVLDANASGALERWTRRVVPNTRGEPAAELESRIRLERGPEAASPVLSPGVRGLVRVSAALARGEEGTVRAALIEASETTAVEEVEECLLQSHLFVGFPGALNGFRIWREVSGTEPSSRPEDRGLWMERGRALCRRIYGSAYDGLRVNVGRLHPDLDRWMVEEGYGKVLGRAGLGLATRELCVVAILAVQNRGAQLHSHLRGALRVGCRSEEVSAALETALEVGGSTHRTEVMETWRTVREREETKDRSTASAEE